MKTDLLLEEIRDLNISYMLLAKQMIKDDREQAMYRLGLSEEAADNLSRLSPAQVLKIAASNMLACRFRFDDRMILDILTRPDINKRNSLGAVHASILMSGVLAEAA
jgi:flagellar transcriptional activator FlhD